MDLLFCLESILSDKCSGGLSISRHSLVSSNETHTRKPAGGLSPLANGDSIIFCQVQRKTNSQNIKVSFQDDTPLPFGKAA